MESAQELAHYFVSHITQSTVGVEARIKSALTTISSLTDKGWSLHEIKNELDQFAKEYPDIVINIYHMDEIMGNKEPANNLIEPDVFYYHNALREVSPPTRIVRDKATGKFVKEKQPFFLEMKKKFTLEELLSYWYQKMEITPNEHMRKQDEGKFKYILGSYTLDEVLFAIDASRTIRKERHVNLLRNAFELDKYMEDAREFIRAKENTHKMQGINREFKRTNEPIYLQ